MSPTEQEKCKTNIINHFELLFSSMFSSFFPMTVSQASWHAHQLRDFSTIITTWASILNYKLNINIFRWTDSPNLKNQAQMILYLKNIWSFLFDVISKDPLFYANIFLSFNTFNVQMFKHFMFDPQYRVHMYVVLHTIRITLLARCILSPTMNKASAG